MVKIAIKGDNIDWNDKGNDMVKNNINKLLESKYLNTMPYVAFKTIFNIFYENEENTLGNVTIDFKEDIKKSFANAKVFEVEDEIKQLLLLTKPTKSELMLPFDSLFIDVRLEQDKTKIIGILVRNGTLFKGDKCIGKDIRITIFTNDNTNVMFHTFALLNKTLSYNVKDNNVNLSRAVKKLAKDFVINFINFINQRDIKIIDVIRSEKNQARRLKESKPILPSTKKIIVTDYIKEYLNELHGGGHIDYSHRFWVRGFWRTLRNKQRYKEKAGTKIWVLPFVKGKGLLIEKKYIVREKND